MKVGDLVCNMYHGILRFGTISNVSQRGNTGWTYYGVLWHEDDKYNSAIKWRNRMRGVHIHQMFYRADELTPVDGRRIGDIVDCHNSIVNGLVV